MIFNSKLKITFDFIKYTLCIIIFTYTASNAQIVSSEKYIGVHGGPGIMMLPDNKKFGKSTFNGKMHTIQISYMFSMRKPDAEWVRRLNVKYQSFNFSYRDQRDLDGVNDSIPGVFGNVISLNYNIYNRLIGNEKHALYLLPGFGLSYDTKTYFDEKRNNFIGTHINFLSSVELAYMFNINERFKIILEGGYFHYSNAAVVLPNQGVNSLNVMVGLRYKL